MEIERNDFFSINIISDGDIVFLIDLKERRLKIYSLFFKNISKFFNVLFRSYFSENKNFGNKNLTEIPLSDDNIEIIIIIFNIIYSRNNTIRTISESDEIL
jgi:hypothetical protein